MEFDPGHCVPDPLHFESDPVQDAPFEHCAAAPVHVVPIPEQALLAAGHTEPYVVHCATAAEVDPTGHFAPSLQVEPSPLQML